MTGSRHRRCAVRRLSRRASASALHGFSGFLAAISLSSAALAASPAHLCDRAARIAAEESGVPESILFALTRTETGRGRDGRLEPWPWTVNMEGEGRWFDNREAALAYVERSRARGARSFDIGCFQVNHRWHGDAFASVEEMFDPAANARYAARFLRELQNELRARPGDWVRVAGAYHSRTPVFANAYRARFAEILDAIGADGFAPLRAASRPLSQFASAGGSLSHPVGNGEGVGDARDRARKGGVRLAFRAQRGGASGLLRGASGPLTGPRSRREVIR